jgi:hypothetical protein
MSGRLSTDLPFTCATCEIEIAGSPTLYVGLPFCCTGCVAGGPCTCSYDAAPSDSRVRECHDVGAVGVGEASSRVVESVVGRRN